MAKDGKKNSKNKNRGAALALLRDPRFLYRVGQKLTEFGVIGEKRNGLIIFLACVTRVLLLCVSLILKGSSSGGKSSLLRSVLRLFEKDCVINVTSLSAKALAYGDGSLRGKILFIAEYTGGRDAAYLTRLLQSEGEIAHEYAYVSGRSRGTIIARRSGTPVVLTTTTERSVFLDDENRFASLSIDESGDLTRQIIRSRLQPAAGNGSNPSTPIEVWQEATRILGQQTPRFEFPQWFGVVADLIPVDHIRARRDIDRFRSLLEAVALCRSFSDGRRDSNNQVIEVNFADYCVAHTILNDALSATYRGTHPQALQVANTVVRLNRKTGCAVTVDEIKEALQWERPLVYKWLKRAANDGLVAYEPGTQQKNQKLVLPGPVRNLRFLPSPERILEKRPDLGDRVRYVDPITGKRMVIR
jgi:hypothetical protein